MKKASPANRLLWIDNLRGFSIFFVILLHVSITVEGNNGVVFSIFNQINTVLTPFRLGLMFFVSGLFFSNGINKGVSIFIKRKVKAILYPFLIWSLIYSLAFILAKRLWMIPSAYGFYAINHLSGGGDITWFLHSLFVFFIISIFTHKVSVYIVVPVCWVLYFLIPEIPENSFFSSFDNGHFNKSLLLFIFFHLGCVFSEKKSEAEKLCNRKSVIIISALFSLVISIVSVNQKCLANLFSFSAIPFFMFLANTKAFYVFNYFGSRSISFYLSHYLILLTANKMLLIFFVFPLGLKYALLFSITLIGAFLVTYGRRIRLVNKLFVMS